jgi:hypothetical protein
MILLSFYHSTVYGLDADRALCCLNGDDGDDSLVVKWGKANSVHCAERAKEWGWLCPLTSAFWQTAYFAMSQKTEEYSVILSFVPV